MASPPLKGRYKRYKQLNQVFESWLLRAAKNTKQNRDDVMDIPDKLNTTQYLYLTEYICSAGDPSSVTPGIVNILDEVVFLRQQAMECHAAVAWKNPERTDDTTLLSNQTHRHFVKVLQKVLSLLRSAVSSTDQQKGQVKYNSEASSTPRTSNFFAQLPVEEPSACPMGQQPMASRNEDSSLPEEAADVDQNNEEAEKEFAIICFFQDARDIWQHLLGVWKRFYRGEISFALATHVTEIAFDMLCDLDEVLKSIYEDLWDIDLIYKSLGLNTDDFSSDRARIFSKVFRDKEPEAADLYSIAGWCTVYEFEDLCAARRNGEVEQPPDESYFCGHPFAQDLFRLQPAVQKLVNIVGNAGSDSIPGLRLDSFTVLLGKACKYSEISASLVVECQVMLEIYDALGGNCLFGYDTLRCAAGQTMESLDKFFGSFPQNYETMEEYDMPTTVGVVLKDKYSAPSRHGHKQKPSTFLKVLPLLSGYNLNICYTDRYETALSLINESLIMLSAAYLYKAVKMASSTNISWPAMDFVIKKQSSRSAYVRDADSVTGFIRHFELALGNSAVNFARGTTKRRKKQPIPRNMLSNARKLEPTPRDILAAAKVRSMPYSNTEGFTEFYAELYFTVHDTEKSKLPQKDHEPLSLLADLEEIKKSDEEEFTFDYLAVAAQSNYLLGSVAKLFEVEEIDDMNCIPRHEMVRILFWLASTKQPTLLSRIGLRFNEFLAESPTQSSVPATTHEKPCERWNWGTEQKPISPDGRLAQEIELRLRRLKLTWN